VRYRVLCVGRRARDPLLDVADEYQSRISRFARIEVVRLKEGSTESERDAFLARLRPEERLVALDEGGDQISSEQLANLVDRWQRDGVARVALVIGGANGLHADMKRRADTCFSLSRLTLPHRLALVVALEQIYRAHTLLRGEPYHRA
jgi:23S rRNA (pseudouridine1915-N3)-methyltransferase